MGITKFDSKELKVVSEIPNMFGGSDIPVFSYPVSCKEACKALYERKPIWQAMLGFSGAEIMLFTPRVNPDNIARAFVADGTFVPGVSNQSGGTDMFGIEWEYVPIAYGSMVRPGNPLISDANEIGEKIKWPDIESWDWEDSKKENELYLSTQSFNFCMLFNGWFERLVSFMDFEGAVVAMIDEDQKQAVKDFFDKLSDLYIRILDKYITYFPKIDAFCLHDDWGSQKDTFFSPETAEEMLVPYLKKVTDFLHSKGMFVDMHSCGKNIKQVPNIIAAGFDSWTPQTMNDTHKIYELYGDKLIIGVMPELYDINTTSEEEQRELARAYANRFCRFEKPSGINMYASIGCDILTKAYREELYKQSRINYSK